MVIRRWVIACLALGFLFGVLVGIATVHANLTAQSANATLATNSNPKTSGRDQPEAIDPDDESADDESLSSTPYSDDERNGADWWLDENPFAPGG
jgi:hypothetical protein